MDLNLDDFLLQRTAEKEARNSKGEANASPFYYVSSVRNKHLHPAARSSTTG